MELDLLNKIPPEVRILWINMSTGVGSMRSVPVHQDLNASVYNRIILQRYI